MKKAVVGLLLIGLVSFAGLGQAADPTPPPPPGTEAPAELLKDATRNILNALGLFLQSIPQYEAPEILENGDIIIRRKNPKPDPKNDPGNNVPEKTRT